MSCYYVIGATHPDSSEMFFEFWFMFEADSWPEAVREARRHLLESPDIDFRTIESVYLVEAARDAMLDLDALKAEHDALLRRKEEDRRVWEQQYEEMRDELGHWRTLLKRGQCASAQVAVLEDRLKGHLAAKP